MSDTFLLTVTAVNDPPDAVDDEDPAAWSTFEDAPFSPPSVLANDSDPDPSDTLTVESIDTSATEGLVSDNGDGTVLYNPNGASDTLQPGEQATDTFTYTVSDGHGGRDTATVTITVDGLNHAPTANPDGGASFITTEDELLTVLMLLNDSDPDPGDVLSLGSVDSAGTTGGVRQVVEATFAATLDEVDDGDGLFAANGLLVSQGDPVTGEYRFLVTPPSWVDPPMPAAANSALYEAPGPEYGMTVTVPAPTGTSLVLNAGALGINVGNDLLQQLTTEDDPPVELSFNIDYYAVATEPQPVLTGAAVALLELTQVTEEGVLPDALSSAALPLKVPGPADFPSSHRFLLTMADEASGRASIASGALTSLASRPPTSVVYDPRGVFDFLREGEVFTDTFGYQVSDPHGATATAPVTITVVGVNDPPWPGDDSYSGAEDAPIVVTAPAILGNDVDPEDDPLTASLVTLPGHGALTLNGDGSFTYVPELNFSGLDSFVYEVSDGTLTSPFTAAVRLVVGAVDDSPRVVRNTGATLADCGLVEITQGVLQASDLDTPASNLTFTLAGAPVWGTLAYVDRDLGAGDTFTQEDIDRGHLIYVHGCDGPPEDAFTFTVSDGATGTPVTTFQLTIDVDLSDSDGDGVPNAVENGAPGGGNANCDGELDRRQATAASLVSLPGSSQYMTVELLSGCDRLQLVASANETASSDDTYRYPFGAVSFTVPCPSATVRLIVHGQPSLRFHALRALGLGSGGSLAPTWHNLASDADGSMVVDGAATAYAVLRLSDGGVGEHGPGGDGEVGFVGGLAEMIPIPATSPVGLLLLVGLLAVAALAALRRAA